MTDKQREQLRRLIRQAHIEGVIREVGQFCREQAAYCDQNVELHAIGGEWSRAADYLDKAAEEVEA